MDIQLYSAITNAADRVLPALFLLDKGIAASYSASVRRRSRNLITRILLRNDRLAPSGCTRS